MPQIVDNLRQRRAEWLLLRTQRPSWRNIATSTGRRILHACTVGSSSILASSPHKQLSIADRTPKFIKLDSLNLITSLLSDLDGFEMGFTTVLPGNDSKLFRTTSNAKSGKGVTWTRLADAVVWSRRQWNDWPVAMCRMAPAGKFFYLNTRYDMIHGLWRNVLPTNLWSR